MKANWSKISIKWSKRAASQQFQPVLTKKRLFFEIRIFKNQLKTSIELVKRTKNKSFLHVFHQQINFSKVYNFGKVDSKKLISNTEYIIQNTKF